MSQRFYFDTFNGTVTHDDVGCVLPNLLGARREARRLLQELMGKAAPEQNRAEFRADVRDESGRRVFSARMSLRFEND